MAILPTPEENPDGLHRKYHIQKTNGQPLDPNSIYFVLRLDGNNPHAAACRAAALVYCDRIEEHIPQLAGDLRAEVRRQARETLPDGKDST